MHNTVSAMPRRKAPGYGLPHPCSPSLKAMENSTSRNMQPCHAKAMLCFKSGGSTSVPEQHSSCRLVAFGCCCCWRWGQCGNRSDERSMRTDCSFLLLRANFDCQRIFCIRSKASFHMHFIDRPCVVALAALPALVDGPRQNAYSVRTDC